LVELSLSFVAQGFRASAFLSFLFLREVLKVRIAIESGMRLVLGSKGVPRGPVLLARAEERKFLMRRSGEGRLSAPAFFTAVYWRGWAFDRGV
jgi:hypothetical protein